MPISLALIKASTRLPATHGWRSSMEFFTTTTWRIGNIFARRYAVILLQHAAHPQRYRIEVGAHADNFAGKIFGLLNAACRIEQHVAMAKFPVRKYRDRSERRAAGHPTEKHAHLELAHIEF